VEDALEFIKNNYFNKFFKPTPAILQAMHSVSSARARRPGRSGIARAMRLACGLESSKFTNLFLASR